ncbi:MAG: ThuA domain-containing protein [Kiritimatiellia bacterium]
MITLRCLSILLLAHTATAAPVRVLLLSGQNNHDWKTTTPVLQETLAKGGYQVEVTERPDQMTADSLKGVGVIVSNWNTFAQKNTVPDWPPAAREAFTAFVRDGGGFVGVHAGTSAFYDWPDAQKIFGATWTNGKTHHKAPHTFLVTPETVDHPLAKGWVPFQTTDELWLDPGIHPDALVLAKADGQAVAVTTTFGKGRCTTMLMGHSADFMRNPGFAAMLLRSVEWAATGTITGPDPAAAVNAIRTWTHGQDRTPLLALAQLENTAPPLAALLASDATPDAKKFAIGQLAVKGAAAQVPALAALLADPEFASEAAGALGRIPGPESLAALRDAVAKAPPALASSILSALAPRRDEASRPLFKAALASDNPATAEVSTHALGLLASHAALDDLNAARPNPALQDARLNCAIALGDAAVLVDLSAPGRPAHVRRAAFLARLRQPGPDAKAALQSALAGNDPVLLAPAISALRNPALRDLLPAAASRFPTLTPAAQIQMLGVIAETGGADLRPTIMSALENGAPEIRAGAIPALGATGDGSSVPVLLNLLAAADKETKAVIATALARLPGDGVNEALAAAATPEAIRALVARNATATVPALLALAAKNDREAILAAGRLGAAANAPALLALLDTATDRAAVETALVSLGRNVGDATFLVDALNGSASGEAKASMLNALAGLGGDTALAALRGVLRQPEGGLRTAAVRALAGMDNPAVLGDLVAAAAGSTDEKTRVLALRGVIRLEPSARKALPAAEVDALLEQARALATRPQDKLALGGAPDRAIMKGVKAESVSGLKSDFAGGGPADAVDGKTETYWDETDHQKLYQLRITLPEPRTIAGLRITGFQQHEYSPRDFTVLCDGKAVATVRDAQYDNNVFIVDLPPTRCTTVQLDITGSHGPSPAIRELDLLPAP